MRSILHISAAFLLATVAWSLQTFSTSAHAAAPADIQTFQELLNRSSHEISTADLERRLIEETLKQIDSIARSRVYPAWFRSSEPLIAEEAANQVRANLRSSQRRDAIIDAITGVTAERVMAKAAGVPAPVVPRQNPEQPLSLSASVSGGGLLGLVVEASHVVNDRGSFGSANGILDPGEFAEVKLVFENLGKERLTSTSIYVDSLGPCLYSEDSIGGEIQMPELDPGALGRINLKLYASAKCPTNTTTLRLRAHDSHLFSKEPIRFNINFKLGSLGRSRLVNLRIDTDDYGHSEPTTYPKLKPLDQVEIATGLALTGSGYSEVRQQFHVMPPVQSSHSPAFVDILRTQNGSIARMADDVDISVPREQPLKDGLAPIAKRMRWLVPADARIFVAVDSTIVRDSAAVTAANIETVVRMDKDRVEEILREHVDIDPITSRTSAAAEGLPIVAVNGFSVSVADADAFMKALEESARIQEESGTDEKPGIVYVLRHYIDMPIQWAPEPPPPDPACKCEIKGPKTAVQGTAVNFNVRVFGCPLDAPSYTAKFITQKFGAAVPVTSRFTINGKADQIGMQKITARITNGTGDDRKTGDSCSARVKVIPPPAEVLSVVAVGITSLKVQSKVDTFMVEDETDTFMDEDETDTFTNEERIRMGAIHVQGGKKKLRTQGDFVFGKIEDNIVVELGVGPRFNVVHHENLQVGAFTEVGIRAIQGTPTGSTQAMVKTGVSAEATYKHFAVWTQTSFTPKTPDDKLVGTSGSISEKGVLGTHMSVGIGGAF